MPVRTPRPGLEDARERVLAVGHESHLPDRPEGVEGLGTRRANIVVLLECLAQKGTVREPAHRLRVVVRVEGSSRRATGNEVPERVLLLSG